ncbi:hypothetical protein [Candidatus Palauibacter sp.]|uniref:hypothetical protein n=1 Tax=Candidatus Palauibacter sp. TaxID=3101350 RepID=UPI003B523DE8
MKLQIDAKFLTTWSFAFALVVVAVVGVNAVVGLPAATVAAAAMGVLATKMFDKFEYEPDQEIRFGAPTVSVPWLAAAMASTLILYGSRLGLALFGGALGADVDICRPVVLIPAIALDWGGFVLGGWLIATLFKKRSVGLASIAAFVVIVEALLDLRTVDAEQLRSVMECLGVVAENRTDAVASLQVGMFAGLVIRAFLSILVARWVTRRSLVYEPSTPSRTVNGVG